jgi:phenylacetate-CoA ligase
VALLQTRSDLARLAYNEELAFAMAGIDSKDTLLVVAALDRCFMAGLAYYLGGLKLCARTVRAGAGSPAQLWQLLKCTGTTAVVGVPSLMWKMAQYAIENGEDPSRAGVRRLIGIGEPVRDRSLELLPVTRQLEDVWGARVYSTYASTESATSFCECSARQGGHLRPELVVLEIVDQKGEAVPDGEPGEIVVTPLGVTGMPFIRFNTGDVSFVIRKECACGRKTPRLGPVLGRKNQMLKYKGTTIYPNTIISVIEGKKDFVGGYVEARRNEDGTDRVILYVSVADPLLSMEHIKDEFRARIRVVPEIRIISEKELYEKTDQPQKRKKTTFFDLR